MTIPKKIIERNIKNSTITSTMNSVKVKPTEKLPVKTDESKNPIVSKNVGETNMIKIDIIKHANPQSISVNAVIYFEFNNSFLVTGRVCVK